MAIERTAAAAIDSAWWITFVQTLSQSASNPSAERPGEEGPLPGGRSSALCLVILTGNAKYPLHLVRPCTVQQHSDFIPAACVPAGYLCVSVTGRLGSLSSLSLKGRPRCRLPLRSRSCWCFAELQACSLYSECNTCCGGHIIVPGTHSAVISDEIGLCDVFIHVIKGYGLASSCSGGIIYGCVGPVQRL